VSFLTPWFLLGGLAVGVPIWVHLIRRQQADPLRLPSLMFFRRMPVRTMSRRHLQHLLLLAARCLLILLLALAFARPFLPWLKNAAAVGPKSHLYVILVDVSASMKYGDRAAKALSATRDVLGKMGPLDQAQIVAFDSEAHILNAASSDRAMLTALAESELKPGASATRYAAAFATLDKLARVSPLPTAAFLITDAQKTGWTAGSDPPHLAPGGTLEWIVVDDRPHPNFSVADVRVAHDTFQSRYPRHIQVRVNGYGTPAAHKEVIFSLNGREIQRRKADLPANGAATVIFDPFDLPPGISRGEIRLSPGDDFPSDDARYFTLLRRDPHKLLFLSGAADRALIYFREALSAGEDPAFAMDARSPSQGLPSLTGYAAVVLFNASSLPSGLAPHLKDYVEKGGGLWISPGDRTDWPAMSSALGILLPAASGDKVYVEREREGFLTIGDFRRDHALFQAFTGPAAAGLTAAHVFGYFRLKLPENPSDGTVLARLSNGDPAVIEKQIGKGHVLLFASPPDNIWCDLPIRPGFVPLLNQLVRYLGSVADDPPYYIVPANARLTGPSAVLDPHGKRLSGAEPSLQDGAAFARLEEAGFYEVRRQGQTSYIAANSDPRESDLTPLSTEDRQLLSGQSSGGASAAGSAQEKPTREEMEKRQGLWWPVLLIAALLALLEAFAGNDLFRMTEEGR
jgi:hypothetical protein